MEKTKPQKFLTINTLFYAVAFVVTGSAFAISYATIVEAARLAGVENEYVFPLLLDIAMISAGIYLTRLKMLGRSDGRGWAYAIMITGTFLSIVINVYHHWGTQIGALVALGFYLEATIHIAIHAAPPIMLWLIVEKLQANAQMQFELTKAALRESLQDKVDKLTTTIDKLRGEIGTAKSDNAELIASNTALLAEIETWRAMTPELQAMVRVMLGEISMDEWSTKYAAVISENRIKRMINDLELNVDL